MRFLFVDPTVNTRSGLGEELEAFAGTCPAFSSDQPVSIRAWVPSRLFYFGNLLATVSPGRLAATVVGCR